MATYLKEVGRFIVAIHNIHLAVQSKLLPTDWKVPANMSTGVVSHLKNLF